MKSIQRDKLEIYPNQESVKLGEAEHRSIAIPVGNPAGLEFCSMDIAMGEIGNSDELSMQDVPSAGSRSLLDGNLFNWSTLFSAFDFI